MTAKVAAGLEQRYVDTRLGLRQPIGAREPRNPRSDYRNFHDVAPCVLVFCVDCLMALTALCVELPAVAHAAFKVIYAIPVAMDARSRN